MATPQSMKISQLIKELNQLQKQIGDVPVYLSRDSEGNGYGSLDASMSFGEYEKKAIILYPIQEFFDFG